MEKKKPNTSENKKSKTVGEMDRLRKPGLAYLPPTADEFRIVSPDLHVPAGQSTHE